MVFGPRGSALAELEPAPGPLAAVLLPLFDAWVASEEAAAAERRAQLGVRGHQRLGDAVTEGAGLAGNPAAEHHRLDVELAHRVGEAHRLLDDDLQRPALDVVRQLAAVH